MVKFLGGMPNDTLDVYKEASPLLHIDKNTPPVLLLHGDHDSFTPTKQSISFAEKLNSIGDHAEFQISKGEEAIHGFFNYDPYFEETLVVMEKFVLGHFGLVPPKTSQDGCPGKTGD